MLGIFFRLKNQPLDLYRAPMWHAEYDDEKRTPYAASSYFPRLPI